LSTKPCTTLYNCLSKENLSMYFIYHLWFKMLEHKPQDVWKLRNNKLENFLNVQFKSVLLFSKSRKNGFKLGRLEKQVVSWCRTKDTVKLAISRNKSLLKFWWICKFVDRLLLNAAGKQCKQLLQQLFALFCLALSNHIHNLSSNGHLLQVWFK